MRILRVHNRYQHRGGEDAVFDSEISLLQDNGETVSTLVVTNDEISTDRTPFASISIATSTVWSRAGRRKVADAIKQHRPDVVHFDNTFPLISPAAYSVARAAGTAVVQTLHNYRLLCPAATFYRDGHICEDCLRNTLPYPSIVHGCYRNSHSQSAIVTAMLTTHRALHTWSQQVDRYIALSKFARAKFIQGGLPEELIAVKPNFVSASQTIRPAGRGDFLFVGRLALEKGIRTLIAAQSLHGQTVRVAGTGPIENEVIKAAASYPALQPLGRLDAAAVRSEMLSACALVFPSEWFEGFPVTLVEAFAAGLPVIASRLGSMAEIVEDGVTGLHFEPGNPADLAAKIRWATDHPDEMRQMGENARREYEEKYTPERNYELLMDIYQQAINHARSRVE